MTCLGERLTALVDGELDHDERDRALAHLAVCRQCRQEADTLRRLKSRLRALAGPPQDDAPDVPGADFLSRLRALGEQSTPDGPADPPPMGRPEPLRRTRTQRPRDTRPSARAGGTAAVVAVRRRIPRRYLAAGAAAMVIGFGTASYTVGGQTDRTPSVVPSFDRFEVEHALTNGVLPLTETSPAPAAP